MDRDAQETNTVLLSVFGLFIAVIACIASAFLSLLLLSFIGGLAGAGENILATFSWEAISLWCGGQAAMGAVHLWIKGANKRFVLYGFCTIILLLAVTYIIYVGPVANDIGSSLLETILVVITLLVAIISAFVYSKKNETL
jgi:hypothetical protein